MRRRSRTNSRPQEDLGLRETYMEHVFDDELLPYFPLDGIHTVKVPGHDYPLRMHHGAYPLECHHLWGRALGNGRWDRVWNLVGICRPVHEFCHRYRVDGIVLCLRRKFDAGEWRFDEAKECLGFDPHGWLEARACQFGWAERIRGVLINEIAKGEVQ